MANDLKVEITEVNKHDNWVRGKYGKHSFSAKVFDDPSLWFGIKGGRVSKLFITDERQRIIIQWEHQWELRPTESEYPVMQAIVKALDEMPKSNVDAK